MREYIPVFLKNQSVTISNIGSLLIKNEIVKHTHSYQNYVRKKPLPSQDVHFGDVHASHSVDAA